MVANGIGLLDDTEFSGQIVAADLDEEGVIGRIHLHERYTAPYEITARRSLDGVRDEIFRWCIEVHPLAVDETADLECDLHVRQSAIETARAVLGNPSQFAVLPEVAERC